MSLVRELATSNAFEKVPTAADSVRFVSAQDGKRYLVQMTDNSGAATARSIDISSLTAPIFTLPFDYLKASRQLEVFELDPGTFAANRLLEKSIYDAAGAVVDAVVPPAATPYFEEISKNEVTIHSPTAVTSPTGSLYLFSIPHTSLPAQNEKRITIEGQADNQALRLAGAGDGFVIKAPNGTEYFVGLSDSGNIIVRPLL